MTMVGTQILLFCLVAIGRGESPFPGRCIVHDQVEVEMNVCTLEDKKVDKVDGVCPVRKMLKKTGPLVCNDIEIKVYHVLGDAKGYSTTNGHYCVKTYEVALCEDCSPLAHFSGIEGDEKCQTTVANCRNEKVKSPSRQTCFVF